MNEINQMASQAKVWIFEMSQMIRTTSKNSLIIDTKTSASDLVTNVDKEVEKFFKENIKKTYPEHLLLGEEGLGDEIVDSNGTIWILDPIDGTTNFIHQQRNFAISLGVFRDGKPLFGFVYDVMRDDLFHAICGEGAFLNETRLAPLKEKKISDALITMNSKWLVENGRLDDELLRNMVKDVRETRSYGSCAIEMSYVAAGMLDGYLSAKIAPWDIAGAWVIGNEVGAIATEIDGTAKDVFGYGGIVFAAPGVHKELIRNYVRGI